MCGGAAWTEWRGQPETERCDDGLYKYTTWRSSTGRATMGSCDRTEQHDEPMPAKPTMSGAAALVESGGKLSSKEEYELGTDRHPDPALTNVFLR